MDHDEDNDSFKKDFREKPFSFIETFKKLDNPFKDLNLIWSI